MEVNPPVRPTQAQRTAATRAVLIAAARELFAAVHEDVEAELVTEVATRIATEKPDGALAAVRLVLDLCSAPAPSRQCWPRPSPTDRYRSSRCAPVRMCR
jgi:hypothetical protein